MRMLKKPYQMEIAIYKIAIKNLETHISMSDL